MKKYTIFNTLVIMLALAIISCDSTAEKNQGLMVPEATSKPVAGQQLGEAGSGKLSLQEANAATATNLLTAFNGETTASAKYAAYAQKAKQEGYPRLALLFNATSRSESIHADNHKAVLEEMGITIPIVTPEFKVGTSRENLVDAIAGESYEIATMYPEFLTMANAADNQLALVSLNYAYKTEMKHKPLYENALAMLQVNQVETLPAQYLICPTCGNTYDGAAPKRCRISMTDSRRFITINS